MRRSILLSILFLSFLSCTKEDTYSFPRAKEQNIDEEKLILAFRKMEQVDGALSLVVSKNGTVVAEKYFSNKENLHGVMSVTKSFIGVLVGIAIDKGFIEDVNDPIGKYLKGLVIFPDVSKENITIEQLLKMSAGHVWNGTGPGSLYMDWVKSEDELKYIINLPLTSNPGTVFNYSDGASHLLSVVISKATGRNTADFAKSNLFEPMGIQQFGWARDSRNYPNGAAGLSLRPGDLVKFGQLILNKGKYNGIQIVSESWINAMTTSRISTNNNVLFGPEYGYQIWINSSKGQKYLMAMGWGGQFIFIFPDRMLVITATCRHAGLSWQAAGEHWKSIANIIMNEIFPLIN
jgi:CubicO group peptidase (beta-lactamase class C family)